jgi:O-antigen/teichoic acid export membrane protein
MNIGRLSVDLSALNALLRRGTPFLFVGVAMVLQPSIDAGFLSKLAPADVVGWYSAARRLIGFLVFPVSALAGALYPTLCRLQATNLDEFSQTAGNALRVTGLLVMPVALGCALYPDIGIALFDRSSFLPAEDDLRLLSIYLFLLFFTMPLGISIMAAGGQRAWAMVQFSCLIISLVLDPILVPLFQQRTGNGGLGLCVAAAVSEVIVLSCGVLLGPRGIFGRRFWRSFLAAALSGGAMVVVARLLKPTSSYVAAPLAVTAYVGCLWMTGGFDKAFVASLIASIAPKLALFRQAPPRGRL